MYSVFGLGIKMKENKDENRQKTVKNRSSQKSSRWKFL